MPFQCYHRSFTRKYYRGRQKDSAPRRKVHKFNKDRRVETKELAILLQQNERSLKIKVKEARIGKGLAIGQ